MVLHPSVPASNVRELIAYAKANPKKIAYASAGAGSTNHLCGALFEKMTQVSMVHVPYSGGAPAIADTVAGQTQLMFTAGTQSLEHVKAGTLRLMAVTEAKRSPLLPNVPTVAETVPGFEMAVWYAAYGPAGISREIIARLNTEIDRILFLPDVKKQMADIAVEVAKSIPNALAELTRADADKWGKIITDRFTPESEHPSAQPRCPLCAKSGHRNFHSCAANTAKPLARRVTSGSAFVPNVPVWVSAVGLSNRQRPCPSAQEGTCPARPRKI